MSFKQIINKSLFFFLGIYIFIFLLNYLTPMGIGDDYLYSFVWQGKPEFIPLDDYAIRISTWNDLFISQWLHYFTWGGRTVNHTIAQFFLWKGKDVFNYCNAFVSLLLVVEIYWCVNRGNITSSFKIREILGIAFALWAFTPGFVTVFLWLEGACNYLWTSVILLAFLLPYIRKYYCFEETNRNGKLFSIVMFLGGILSGWTNENSICWIIMTLLCFVLKNIKHKKMEFWIFSGLTGLVFGYSLLLFAPGNMARLYAVYGSNWFSSFGFTDIFNSFVHNFSKVLLFQFWLWYYCLKSFYFFKKIRLNSSHDYKDFMLAKILTFVAFGMSVIMLFSPEFPLRSGFPGTVQLIIAVGVLMRLHRYYLVGTNDKKINGFMVICSFYFLLSATVSVYNLYYLEKQNEKLIAYVNQAKENAVKSVLIVESFDKPSRLAILLSGFHIIENDLLEDGNSWENVAFSRYYGINGIRVRGKKSK